LKGPVSREQLEHILDAIPVGVVILDRGGRIVFANFAVEKVLGLKRGEVIGRVYNDPAWKILTVDGKPFPEEDFPFALVIREGESVSRIRHIVERPDGARILLSTSGAPLRDEKGAVVAVVLTLRDVAECQVEAEEELEFRSLLLDSATDSVFVLDPEGNMIYVNEAAYKTRGYTKEELLSMPLRKLDTPEYARLIEPRMRTLMKTGSLVFESVHFRKDGTVMPVEVHARVIEYRGRKVITTVVRDITERKKAERALRQSEEKFRTLFETMAQGVVYHDSTGKIVSANPAAQKMLGLTLDQILGRTSIDPRWRAIHEDGSDFPGETHPAMVALRTGKEVRNVVMGVFNPEEEGCRWININAIPQFRPGETKPYQVYATFDDISGQKRAKELSDALNDINAAVSSTLDFDEIMQRVVVESAKAIGSETAAVDLREDGFWVVRYLYGLSKELIGTRFTDEESRHSVIAARERKPFVSNDALKDERLNRDIVEKHNIKSMLVVPLLIREEVIGVILFINHKEKAPFDEVQVDFAEKLAASVSLALENARLYGVQRHIADTLQESLLVMPEKIEGVEYGYLYRSATEEAKVGGDFYDIFELEHGKVGIVIGDVSGSGIEATSLTIVVKNTIKANAYGFGTPALIMAKTNDLARRVTPAGSFITCFFGVLDIKTGELSYCSAGHPPAIIKRETGGVDLLAKHSPVIGAFFGMRYRTGKERLSMGDTLISYTDGVIEARCDRGFFGEERLVELIEGLQSISAKDVSQAIFGEVIRYAGGKLSDDIAILAVRPNF